MRDATPVETTYPELEGRTLIMSGGLRGVGAALARGFCEAGANVVLIARPSDGGGDARVSSVRSTEEIAGSEGRGLVVRADVRDERSVSFAVKEAADRFGGVDICINNSSALSLGGTEDIAVRTFDLMFEVNVRSAFLLTRACTPYLRRSANPHVLSISPPLNMAPRWLGDHPPYTASKYGTSIMAMGWAVEFADDGIASNCLWPEYAITTEAVVDVLGDDARRWGRDPAVMADAARAMVTEPSRRYTGRCVLDGDVLRELGVADAGSYGGGDTQTDLFVGT